MRNKWILALAALLVVLTGTAGCLNRGDFKISPVMETQLAPHDGYNLSPDIWVEEGTPVPMTGVLVYIEGTDPNSIFE
jgi:hypothetical protein